jgi:hypothetical protein
VSEDDRSRGGARSGFLGPLAFAVAALALGVVVLFGTFGLSAGGGYSPVGPGFFPLVVAGGLLVFGLAFLVRTTVSPDAYLRKKAAATAAVLLAAFQIFDLQPGPLLMERSSGLVWTLIASLYIGNVMLLILNYPLIRIWVKLLAIPKELLYSGILLFATLGVYSLSNSVVDLLVMYAIGVLGFFLRRYDFPVGPVILGVILGTLMETQFRRALQISQGDPTVFVTRPLSLTILLLALVALVLPYLPALIKRLRGEPVEQGRLIFGKGDED